LASSLRRVSGVYWKMIEVKSSIEDVDREFENSKVKVTIIRDLHELEIGGRKIGPFKNGEEIEISKWISEILADQGIVKLREQDILDMGALSKIHWKETIPTSRQLPPLNPDIYCELRCLIRRLKKDSKLDASKLKDYGKAISLSEDIINCRLLGTTSLPNMIFMHSVPSTSVILLTDS